MKKVIPLLICLTFISCGKTKKTESLELEITSNKLVMKENEPLKNILTYQLTNKSNTIYYFNLSDQSDLFRKMNPNLYRIRNCWLVMRGPKNDTLRVTSPCLNFTEEYYSFQNNQIKNTRELGYTANEWEIYTNRNFTIHPNETLHFEELVYLPDSEYYRFHSVSKGSSLGIFILSDTTKLKYKITRPAMDDIIQNKYTVFHGIIKSKNTIPVEIIK